MTLLKVSSRSRIADVAGAIAGEIRQRKSVKVRAIGAGAVNQSIKAVCVARDYLRGERIDVLCQPELVTIDVDGHQRTAISIEIVGMYG